MIEIKEPDEGAVGAFGRPADPLTFQPSTGFPVNFSATYI
jgi:hypothetical protein